LDFFEGCYYSAINNHIPTKMVGTSARKPAWITPTVRKAINKRNRLANIAKNLVQGSTWNAIAKHVTLLPDLLRIHMLKS